MSFKNKVKPTQELRPEFNDPIQERLLVTAMVYAPDMIGEVMKMIPSSQVFQTESTRSTYEVICDMYRDQMEIKRASVLMQMRVKGRMNALKEGKIALEFDSMTPSTPEEISMSCEGLISMYRRQTAYELTLRLNGELSSDIKDSELSDHVYQVYEALTMQGGKNLEKTSKDAADGALKQIEHAMNLKKSGKLSGVPTGSAKLDRILGGWQNDELIILAARPGMGKTAAALDFCLSAAELGYPVGFFSIEMDSEKLNFRLVAAKTRIKYSEMIKGNISPDEFTRIQTALTEIGKLPIYYYDDSSIANVSKLETVAVEWCRKKSVKLLFIDYIQYLNALPRASSYEQISAVSKAVKTMQRKLKVPIIALAQLSREVEKRADPRPLLEDLKESGQLEQDASRVIGLFNPDYYLRKGKEVVDETNGMPFEVGTYCYYILKDRSGGHARIDRYADIPTNRFSDTNDLNQTVLPLPTLNNDVFKTVVPNF